MAAGGSCFVIELVRHAVRRSLALVRERDAAAVDRRRLDDALEGSHLSVTPQDRELRYTWVQDAPGGVQARKVVGLRDGDLFESAEAAAVTSIKTRALAAGELEVWLSVRDHGAGIPEAHQAKIFESFSRSGASPRAADSGGCD